MKKCILSFFLAAAILGSAMACTSPATPPLHTDGASTFSTEAGTPGGTDPIETAPAYDWSTWEPTAGADVTELTVNSQNTPVEVSRTYAFKGNNMRFGVQNGYVKDTAVTLKGNMISSLYLNHEFKDDSVAAYTAKIRVAGGSVGDASCTQYIGLRLSAGTADASGRNGVWLAIRNNEIGLRTNNWPETTYMNIREEGIDLKTERMLYIEDDMAADGDKTYNHYGVAYVDITGALETCGKTVSRGEDVLVLADRTLTDDEILILYRALY